MSLSPPPPREFPVPQGVPTSVTLHELALLQRFASEAGTVLEIGTHYGFSCIGMALAGAHVTSVDPHFEGPANDPDTWEPFRRNCEANGFPLLYDQGALRTFGNANLAHDDIEAIRAAIEDVGDPRIWGVGGSAPRRPFGLVFIDGNHVWPCPWRDAEIAMAHLAEGGRIAFHDVTPNWPGVYRAALQLEAKGWREEGRAGTLRVYRQP
jgi:predicted O-methyltransferase YrrM